MTRTWRGSLGLLLMSAAPAVALSRLLIHGLRPGVIGPMVLAIIVADRGTALVMRFRVPLVPAIAVGALLSLLALLVGFDPSLLDPASPHFANGAYFSGQFHAAQYALVNDGTPLPALIGVVVALGALGGLSAAATRAIWESQLRRELGTHGHVGPLTGCIAPSLGVFVYSTLVSANHGRVPAALAYFTGTALFVALADRTGPTLGARRASWRLPTGAVTSCALVLVLVLVAGAGLSGMRLSVFHVTPPAGANLSGAPGLTSPAQLLTGTALVDDLRTAEIEESDAVIFRARTPLPTYWQVGTLTSFNGTEWLPGRGVDAALAGADNATASSLDAPSLPVPNDGQRFTASVHIADFASRLLPAPPHTVSVHGLAGAVPVGQEGVLASRPSVAGTGYSVTAELPPIHPTNPRQLDLHDPRLAPYLALPREPAIVPFLAHEVVGQLATQGAQVQALVNWFRSGRFRYTLDPPPTSGSDPLVQFLTVTRAGYCQQFAGAFGILARTLGIPTRLVVGFVAGQPGPADSYTITGSDAHVWPQVYLGPGTGWLSVEPTPPGPTNTAAPAGVIGPNFPSGSSPTTLVPSGGTATSGTAAGSSSTPSSHAAARHGGAGDVWLVTLAIVIAFGALLTGVLVLWRRRAPRDRTGSPNQRIVQTWEQAQRALTRHGLARRSAETPAEYAARLGRLEQQSRRRVGADALTHLAALVEVACYAPGHCTVSQVDAARGWASTVTEALRRR
jgi:hypothetical protein